MTLNQFDILEERWRGLPIFVNATKITEWDRYLLQTQHTNLTDTKLNSIKKKGSCKKNITSVSKIHLINMASRYMLVRKKNHVTKELSEIVFKWNV